MKTKCDTTWLGRIFGHKFHYSIFLADVSYSTEYCVRCGFIPTRRN